MDTITFSNISKIIEYDSKTTTYKFALLRGVIDIIQENSPFIEIRGDRVYMPTGLLVEKWMVYYYPIFEPTEFIPQIHGEANIAFSDKLKRVIDYYSIRGGLSVFYNDLKFKGVPPDIEKDFVALAKKMADTIVRMPMKYIGRSITDDYYSIFNYETSRINMSFPVINMRWLIDNMGEFSIPRTYFEAFKLLGSFVNGKNSIFLKWAEFSVNASKDPLSVEHVISKVLRSPVTERDVQDSKKMYRNILSNYKKVYCVWTGALLTRFDIDHMIPFSVWKNNDLWNLLPARATMNSSKRDKIPGVEMIEKQKEIIFYYWELIDKQEHSRFHNELQLSLLGKKTSGEWQHHAINQLKGTCDYLINNRGFKAWSI